MLTCAACTGAGSPPCTHLGVSEVSDWVVHSSFARPLCLFMITSGTGGLQPQSKRGDATQLTNQGGTTAHLICSHFELLHMLSSLVTVPIVLELLCCILACSVTSPVSSLHVQIRALGTYSSRLWTVFSLKCFRNQPTFLGDRTGVTRSHEALCIGPEYHTNHCTETIRNRKHVPLLR